jgi:S-adenosylmethionine synthetase
MTLSFMRADKVLFSSESVTEGHPDKLCDQVSDAVLDALLAKDPMSRVACETATTTGTVLVAGEITTTAYADVIGIVRDVVKDIGYTNAHFGFDYETCGVLTAIKPQSPDIAQGVDRAQDDRAELGAGDQGMMFGFAIDETPEYMPLPITLAHAVAKQLAKSRKSGELKYLRPDGKSQITVEYHKGAPKRVHTVVVATQHDEGIDVEQIRRDVKERIVRPAIQPWGDHLLDSDTRYVINGTGKFVIGGPMGDAGLTGRKIIVDTYGGFAPHGGGAFSGKDATKVDRSGAYAARYVAKNIVAAKLAKRCQIQIAYVIGVAKPVSLNIETFGTGTVDDEVIRRLIDEHFDFRPQEIIERFALRRPIFRQTATYGHFGRPELDLPWEKTDLAETFARSAGSRTAAV